MAPGIFLKRFLSPSPLLFWAYVLPFIYWTYLVLTTNFIVVFDSENYLSLANMFYSPSHWGEYFQTGPNREPLYPMIIALSMHLGHWLNLSYDYILRTLSFFLLAMTMFLTHQCLKKINAKPWLQAAAVFSTGFSPILINSALCVYSEIASLPFTVAAVYFGWLWVDSLGDDDGKAHYPAWGLGLSLLGFTFVKGLGEGLVPLFLIFLFGYAWRRYGGSILSFIKRSKTKIFLVLLIFYLPLIGFKLINYSVNRHFVLTNRADLALYGNLVQRSQIPLTANSFLSHLTTVPTSHDLCGVYFQGQDCYQWTPTASDDVFSNRKAQLAQQNFTEGQKNKIMTSEIFQAVLTHPLEETVYAAQEGMKVFFWEMTQGPFVAYPDWLADLFNQPWLALTMSLGIGFICMIVYLLALTMLKNTLVLMNVTLLGLLILLFSFFNIDHRWTITAGPLFILLAFSCGDAAIKKFTAKRVSSKPAFS